jgi:ABC-type sugar transport system permease subunit
MKPPRRGRHRPQFWFGAAVLVPTMIWYVVFQFGPVLESFWFSLVFVRLLHIDQSRFVGWSNFSQVFDPLLNPELPPALFNTVTWTLMQFAIVVPLSLLLAACLNAVTRGRTAYQVALFLPVITPVVVVGLIMGRFFDPQVGLANGLLRAVGLPGPQWFRNPAMALPLAAVVGAWRWLGLYTILFTAGMLNIPRDLRDAARVDGAGAWVLFRRITLPLLGTIMVLVLILLMVNSVQEYTLPQTLANSTGAGQSGGLIMINQALYGIAFTNLELGVGSAMAVLECVATLLFSLLVLLTLRPRWSY